MVSKVSIVSTVSTIGTIGTIGTVTWVSTIGTGHIDVIVYNSILNALFNLRFPVQAQTQQRE